MVCLTGWRGKRASRSLLNGLLLFLAKDHFCPVRMDAYLLEEGGGCKKPRLPLNKKRTGASTFDPYQRDSDCLGKLGMVQ